MDFCEHRAAKIMAEFDDARAEKLEKKNKKKNKNLQQHRFSSIFHKT